MHKQQSQQVQNGRTWAHTLNQTMERRKHTHVGGEPAQVAPACKHTLSAQATLHESKPHSLPVATLSAAHPVHVPAATSMHHTHNSTQNNYAPHHTQHQHGASPQCLNQHNVLP